MTTDDQTQDQTAEQTPNEAPADQAEQSQEAPAATPGDDLPASGGSDDADSGLATTAPEAPAEEDTFSREYVQELRQQAAGYRTQVRDLQAQLHRAKVEATGALADPADLEFNADHLEDSAALQAAIDALIQAKPHLKSRRIVGDVGQGNRGSANAGVDLLGILRSRA